MTKLTRETALKGMRVKLDKVPGTFVITKINSKTAIIQNVDNEFDEYRASYSLLDTITPLADLHGPGYVPPTILRKGMVVKAKLQTQVERGMKGYWVVTGSAGGKYQISPLGGSDSGRYWSITGKHVDVVSLDELLGLSV